MDNSPATRLWFPSGKIPNPKDFEGNTNACDFSCLWDAVENAGEAIRQNNGLADHNAWVRQGAIILDEHNILTRYDHSLGRETIIPLLRHLTKLSPSRPAAAVPSHRPTSTRTAPLRAARNRTARHRPPPRPTDPPAIACQPSGPDRAGPIQPPSPAPIRDMPDKTCDRT